MQSIPRFLSRTAATALGAFFAFALSTGAQSLVGYDGVTGDVLVFSGGANPGLCGYPNGPVQFQFPATTDVCAFPAPTPFPPPLAVGGSGVGDIAVDTNTGDYYVSNGTFIARYFADGSPSGIASDLVAWGYGNITGAAFANQLTGRAYYTDGTKVGKFSFGLICGGVPSGFGGTFTYGGPGVLTDLDYDPLDDSLWACTDRGDVIHFDASGGVLSQFDATAGTGLSAGLTGLAYDPDGGILFVTDGSFVMSFDTSGTLTTTGRLWWSGVFELAPGNLVGLDYVPAGVGYGAGIDLAGGTAPVLSSAGYAVVGSSGFSLEISQTPSPISTYQFFYTDSGALCPAIPVIGLPALIGAPIYDAGSATTDAFGKASKSVPIPPNPSFGGLEVFVQAVGVTTSATLRATNGLVFTISNG